MSFFFFFYKMKIENDLCVFHDKVGRRTEKKKEKSKQKEKTKEKEKERKEKKKGGTKRGKTKTEKERNILFAAHDKVANGSMCFSRKERIKKEEGKNDFSFHTIS